MSTDAEAPAENGNKRILGKIELPKSSEQPAVELLSCSFPGCKSWTFTEEKAIVPNLDFIRFKVERQEVTADDVRGFVVCRFHANTLEDEGIRCYYLLKTLSFLEKQVDDAKELGVFLGGYDPKSRQLR